MADVDITLTDLVANTRSADLVGAGTAVNAGQTFSIDVKGRMDETLIIIENVAAGAATLTFDAGDEPPSMRASLGSVDVATAASDLRAVILEGGRFMKTSGIIEGSVATNNVRIMALRMPRTW